MLPTQTIQRWAATLWTLVHRTDDDRGATLVEYVLLVALIAVVCIVAISFLGNAASTKFSSVGNNLS